MATVGFGAKVAGYARPEAVASTAWVAECYGDQSNWFATSALWLFKL